MNIKLNMSTFEVLKKIPNMFNYSVVKKSTIKRCGADACM